MYHIDNKAKKIDERKIGLPDGSIVEINIWQLPKASAERPQGYKYRLQYCLPDATTLIRYDNRAGKGDHKHVRQLQVPYKFVSKEKLIKDFLDDVRKHGGQL